ncbi:MAG TPA: aspartate 1-decarboxylase [Candidatus Bathyarchaeia archaeon]|nr:aspartate 1-decarboxylase [Candidatus Bathyarchaeia archaeon]
MQLRMLKGKIHRARVTGADLNYEGSIEIDSSLMEAAGILPFEKVDIWSITNGDRFSTYALPAEPRSGIIALNGAAARKVQPGDEIIITTFVSMNEKEAEHWNPKIVFVDEKNRFKPMTHVPRAMAGRRKLSP